MTLQEQLCEKMRVEQSAYCLWLTAQPPEEILHLDSSVSGRLFVR